MAFVPMLKPWEGFSSEAEVNCMCLFMCMCMCVGGPLLVCAWARERSWPNVRELQNHPADKEMKNKMGNYAEEWNAARHTNP